MLYQKSIAKNNFLGNTLKIQTTKKGADWAPFFKIEKFNKWRNRRPLRRLLYLSEMPYVEGN